MNIKVKKNLLSIIKWVVFLTVSYLLQTATISGGIRPFYFASLFVLIWCNQNILLSSGTYFLSSILYLPTLDNCVSTAVSVGVVLIFYFLHYKLKKPLNIILLCLYAFLSQVYTFYFRATSVSELVSICFEFSLGLIFLIVCLIFFQSLILKRNGQMLNLEQKICGSIFLSIIVMSLFQYNIEGIELAVIISTYFIFLFAGQRPNSNALIISFVCGIGISLYCLDTNYVVLFVSYATFAVIFAHYNAFFTYFSVVAIDVFMRLYIVVLPFNLMNIISITIAFILYLFTNKFLSPRINQYFFQSQEKISLKNVANRSREYQYRQLIEVAKVFNEMDRVFRSMTKGNLPLHETKKILVQELSQVLCKDCLDRANCLRLSTKQTLEIFEILITIALEKGKISLIDIPSTLSQKCTKINVLINTVNNMVSQYKQYSNMQTNMDMSKLLIGEQMGGVAKIIQNLAQNINQSIDFDTAKQEQLIEELNYCNIECNEALIYEQHNSNITTCLLVVNNSQVYGKAITKIVSKILKSPFSITTIEDSQLKGYSNVYLKATSKYDFVFGVAQKSKATTSHSGDTYTFLRLNEDKILFAISDGMGSGDKAYQHSSTSLSLIENFYRAGFDNQTILSSVNKLLTLSGSEIFSAMDICVVDLKSGIADIIKIGAPLGFIKHNFETEILKAGALPMGILEELKPNISKHILEHGDNIILVSDGVLDSFDNYEQAKVFINNLQTLNPQTLADQILGQAIDNDKQSPNDDMTVLVGRIIRNV